MTHGTLIWHRCFCSYCSPSPSPSLKHDTSLSLYTFFLSFFLPPKRSIPRSFPSPFLRRILSNLSLAASPSPSAREWKRALDRCLLSPPVSTRREGWFSRATRNNYATKGDVFHRYNTHPNATCRGMHFNALHADKMRRGWLWEFRDDLASWMNVVQFTSFPPDIIYSFPTFRIFLLLASGFFIYFCAGKLGEREEKRWQSSSFAGRE